MNDFQKLSSILALFGVRYPEAPIYPDVVEGPFVGINGSATIASGSTTALDFTHGAYPLFVADYKLRVYAGVTASGNPTGVLFVDSIGIDFAAGDCTGDQINNFLASWSVVHTPQGSSRSHVIPLAHCARINPAIVTTTANNVSKAASQPQQPMYRIPGGPLKVNLQSDTFQLQNTTGSGVTTGSTIIPMARIAGAYLTQAKATEMKLLGATVACDVTDIPAVVQQRRNLGQHSAGGGVSG